MMSSGWPGVTGVPFSTTSFTTLPDTSACAAPATLLTYHTHSFHKTPAAFRGRVCGSNLWDPHSLPQMNVKYRIGTL